MNFRIYINRWRSEGTYTVDKTSTGWHIRHIAINGDCDKDGTPFLYSNFEQDGMAYPSSIGNFMEYLWEQIDSGGVTPARAQEMLQELADWVSVCERNEPSWPGWN